jgi:hypothetical protein
MPLELEQRKQLQAALLSAFNHDGLRQLVALELGSDLELFTKDGDRRQRVYDLIAWTERTGRTVDLIRGAYIQNPTNPLLAQLVINALRWRVCIDAGLCNTTVQPASRPGQAATCEEHPCH